MQIELDDKTRAEFGVEGRWGLAVRHRVRWSEVDAFSHVNHAAYLEWYEDLRLRYMAAWELPPAMDTPGMVLARMTIEYRQPLRFWDESLVTARVVSFRRSSFVMDFATWKEGQANRAQGLLVMVINATGAKVPIPDRARRMMIDRDGARAESA